MREGLRDEGVLHGRVLEIERLVGLGLTRAQKADTANYRPGDVLVFHNDIYQYRVKADDALTVTGTDRGQVSLDHPDGRRRRLDPSKPIRYRYEAYETRPIRLQAGDRIRWTRNERARRLVNGGEAEILSIGYRFVKIGMEDGRTLSLRREDPQLRHVDHAWSATLHAAQGTTRDNAIVVLDSGHGAPVDRAAFYVGISRARDNAVVLTDNREDLVEALEAHAGLPMTALEAVGEEIAPPVRRPIPAREAVWPELSAWRALEEEARRQDTIPFYLEGCAEAVERLAELGRTPGIAAGVAAEAERAAEAHQAAGEARAALDRLHEGLETQIAGRADVTDGTGDHGRDYVLWREAAQGLLAGADGTAGDWERRRPHLDARPAVRDGIARASVALQGVLDADKAVLPILDEWRGLESQAGEAGTHWFHEDGRADVLARMEALPELPHMDPALRDGMAAIVAEGRGIAAAEEAFEPLAKRLRDCAETRERLIEGTRGEPGDLFPASRTGGLAGGGRRPSGRGGVAAGRKRLVRACRRPAGPARRHRGRPQAAGRRGFARPAPCGLPAGEAGHRDAGARHSALLPRGQ